jgi:hypothetical protein
MTIYLLSSAVDLCWIDHDFERNSCFSKVVGFDLLNIFDIKIELTRTNNVFFSLFINSLSA